VARAAALDVETAQMLERHVRCANGGSPTQTWPSSSRKNRWFRDRRAILTGDKLAGRQRLDAAIAEVKRAPSARSAIGGAAAVDQTEAVRRSAGWLVPLRSATAERGRGGIATPVAMRTTLGSAVCDDPTARACPRTPRTASSGRCKLAPPIALRADGTLHLGDRCIQRCRPASLSRSGLLAGREPSFFLTTRATSGSAIRRFSQPNMALKHLRCLDIEGGRPRTELCGSDTGRPGSYRNHRPPRRVPAGITRTGRAVRLRRYRRAIASPICARSKRPACAARRATAPATSPRRTVIAQLAVEPESLVIGDVDGDAMPDAMRPRHHRHRVRDRGVTGYTTPALDPRLRPCGGANAIESLARRRRRRLQRQRDICGLAANGRRVRSDGTHLTAARRSPWPDQAATLWPGDLDGESAAPTGGVATPTAPRAADRCAGRAQHRRCAVELRVAARSIRHPRAQLSVHSPTSIATAAPISARCATACIVCARSQGHGFGPATRLATLPPGPAPVALWMGDLDGDGAADACVDDGATIRCVRSR